MTVVPVSRWSRGSADHTFEPGHRVVVLPEAYYLQNHYGHVVKLSPSRKLIKVRIEGTVTGGPVDSAVTREPPQPHWNFFAHELEHVD